MMTNTPSPADALCVCGHPRSEHFIPYIGCPHCDCNEYRPASPSPAHDTPKAAILLKPDATYTGNTRVTTEVFKQPSPAHDTPAAKLRERIAELERENEELSRMVSLETNQAIEIGKLRTERDTLRAEVSEAKAELDLIRMIVKGHGIEVSDTDHAASVVSVLGEVLHDTEELLSASGTREREWVRKWRTAQDEADELAKTLANRMALYVELSTEAVSLKAQVAALQPYADMAAGLLAEKQDRLDKATAVVNVKVTE